MKTYYWLIVFLVSFHSVPSSEVLAGRGGGRVGGGARMGGGGARMGGGGARPNFSAHAPSMSRAAPTVNRSNFNRPSAGGANFNRPNINQPNINQPSVNRPQVSRPSVSRPDIGRPNIGQPSASRPNVTRPGSGGFGSIPGSVNRPNLGNGSRPNLDSGNRPSLGGSDRPSIGGANGPTFGDKRPSIGQLDDFLGIPGGRNRPTTLPAKRPGDIGSKLPRGLPNKLPGNIVGNRPSRPNIGGIKDNVNIGDSGIRNRVGNNGSRDVNINAGNQVNIGNRFGDNNVSSIRNKWSGNVNRPFGSGNYWDRGYSRNPNAWRWQHCWNRYPRYWGWRVGTWATVGTYFAWNWVTPTPVIYDYGSTVVYRDNYVYVQDEKVASSQEYYEQASTIAQRVPATLDPETVEWMPLGVFAISAEQATDTGLLIQLAVSKEGIIAGTFYNETTDSSRPIEGTIDRESQRAAWKFADGKNEEVVMETVIHNLTEDESTALVHFGDDKQETWTMLRMDEPEA